MKRTLRFLCHSFEREDISDLALRRSDNVDGMGVAERESFSVDDTRKEAMQLAEHPSRMPRQSRRC